MILYITEQGCYIHQQTGEIVVEKKDEVLLRHPMNEVEGIILFGGIQFSTQVALSLLEQGAEISLLTSSGHYRGRIISPLGKNSEIRVRHVQKALDPICCLDFAKQIVVGKLYNGIYLLSRHARRGRSIELRTAIQSIHEAIEKVNRIERMESLLGLEGQASRVYFGGFAHCLKEPEAFGGRKYFPSPDPVNACLSFGYSFLAREIQGLLEAMGLDSYIGLYHKLEYGRASLAQDLLEELRHPIIDRLVLKLFNKAILQPDDFYKKDEKSGMYLKTEKVKVFIRHYEEYVNKESYGGGKMSVRMIIRRQVETMKRYLSDKVDRYTPFIFPNGALEKS